MEIETQIERSQVRLRIRGRVTRADGDQLKKTITSLNKSGHRHFVVELNDVSDFDSAGLGGLVAASTAVRRSNGSVRVESPPGRTRTLLAATKLLDMAEPSVRRDWLNLYVGVAVAAVLAVLLWMLTS